MDSLQELLIATLIFINWRLVPLVLAVAFLIFIWNVARYFVIGGANDESRARARQLALYGVLAFVFIASIWGIVNLLVFEFGLSDGGAICPDYLYEDCGPTIYDNWGSFNPDTTEWGI